MSKYRRSQQAAENLYVPLKTHVWAREWVTPSLGPNHENQQDALAHADLLAHVGQKIEEDGSKKRGADAQREYKVLKWVRRENEALDRENEEAADQEDREQEEEDRKLQQQQEARNQAAVAALEAVADTAGSPMINNKSEQDDTLRKEGDAMTSDAPPQTITQSDITTATSTTAPLPLEGIPTSFVVALTEDTTGNDGPPQSALSDSTVQANITAGGTNDSSTQPTALPEQSQVTHVAPSSPSRETPAPLSRAEQGDNLTLKPESNEAVPANLEGSASSKVEPPPEAAVPEGQHVNVTAPVEAVIPMTTSADGDAQDHAGAIISVSLQ